VLRQVLVQRRESCVFAANCGDTHLRSAGAMPFVIGWRYNFGIIAEDSPRPEDARGSPGPANSSDSAYESKSEPKSYPL